jgi:hypothetical protein
MSYEGGPKWISQYVLRLAQGVLRLKQQRLRSEIKTESAKKTLIVSMKVDTREGVKSRIRFIHFGIWRGV